MRRLFKLLGALRGWIIRRGLYLGCLQIRRVRGWSADVVNGGREKFVLVAKRAVYVELQTA
jgi:hypothetical protein